MSDDRRPVDPDDPGVGDGSGEGTGEGAGKPPADPNARWSRHPSGDAWAIISYLLSGMAVYGAGGWALDAWLGTGFFLPTGLLLGAGAALYLVWVRYGNP